MKAFDVLVMMTLSDDGVDSDDVNNGVGDDDTE